MTTIAIGALRLHPDAERVPMADASDLRALRASLSENGQQDPLDVTEDGVILDGRTRWTLLRELGALTVEVRVVHVPDDQQTHYIVDRAIARRHLTLAQKRVLNDLLRVQVIEVRQPRYTDNARREQAEPMRIGYGQTERAEKLGVDRDTVARWDEETPLVAVSAATSAPVPTHAIDKRGRPQPIRKPHPEPEAPRPPKATAAQAKPTRYGPPWMRHFTKWCRAVLPEDRPHVLRMSAELHEAMALLDLTCNERETK